MTCYDHVEPMQWRHLNVFNKECVIVAALPRGKPKYRVGLAERLKKILAGG